jgi:hypothetical protein
MTLAVPASGRPRPLPFPAPVPTRRPLVHARLVGVVRTAQEDAGRLLGPAWQALRGGHWRRLGLGRALAAAVVVLVFAAHAAPRHVARQAVVRADQPLGIVLARLPLSLVAPTDAGAICATVATARIVVRSQPTSATARAYQSPPSLSRRLPLARPAAVSRRSPDTLWPRHSASAWRSTLPDITRSPPGERQPARRYRRVRRSAARTLGR